MGMNNDSTALLNDIRLRDPEGSTNLQVDVVSSHPLVVTVSGEIDIASAPALREGLMTVMRRHGHGIRLALDLDGVTFMDCAGINVLLAAHRHARLKDGWVQVLRASHRARKVLMITGVHQELGPVGAETALAA